MQRAALVLVLCGLCGAASFAQEPASAPASAPADTAAAPVPGLDYAYLDGLSCRQLADVFHVEIPRFVYDDQPDLLYELVIYTDDRCDPGEPLGRVQILASIWDANFDEVIYGYEVMDWLAARWDPARRPAAGTARAVFDTFTVDFADQLLPHQPDGSLEQFFCLFYSGRPEQAWGLLRDDDALADSWLRYYDDEEYDLLTHREAPYLLGVYGGRWSPRGNLSRVGSRPLVGASIEQWTGWGYLRVAIEGRLGRADRPYYVLQEDVAGFSDRWNALLVALEGGTSVWRRGRHLAEVFAGIGYDAVKPFRDADFAPAGLNLAVGAGWRTELDRQGRWFLRLDGRYERIGTRNRGGTPLDGAAWSLRAGLGLTLGRSPEPRLRALGHRID